LADLKAAVMADQGRVQWTIANARALAELDVAAAAQSVAEAGGDDGP
jgi:hypothetical protein